MVYCQPQKLLKILPVSIAIIDKEAQNDKGVN